MVNLDCSTCWNIRFYDNGKIASCTGSSHCSGFFYTGENAKLLFEERKRRQNKE